MLSQIRQRQYWLLWTIIGGLSMALLGVCTVFLQPKNRLQAQQKTPKKSLTTGASRVNPQEVWVHDLSARMDINLKRLDALDQSVEKLIQLNTRAMPSEAATIPLTPAGAVKEAIAQTLDNPVLSVPIDAAMGPSQPDNATSLKKGFEKPFFKSQLLKKITLSLKQNPQARVLKSTDNTIPSGAFAEAVLISGVDASTAIQASSDPRPVLLRLIHPGTLPRRFQSDLEGCHVSVASYGDISSERVFMRLEKLSCVERKTGEVMSMAVQGYVAGEDGRVGIRGVVVDKAGASMRNAMVGGFFSSFGNFLGQNKSPLLFSPTMGFSQQNTMTGMDLFKQSAGTGMGGALSKYADFYIKRAEQMQPVIQVAAGRKVDVVFNEDFDFSDSALRKTLSKSHDQTRFQQVQQVEETKPFQSWLPTSEGEQQ